MNEKEGKKRREWVKNAAIVFLTIMLVLTFFSNTIMNYSLPEVATQYVQSGSITAKVRGTGNVTATDPYNVMITESRVISGVAVKQGDEVEKDQIIYYLEDAESEELKTAQAELSQLELDYMKGLFGGTVSPDIINKVASGKTDNFASYRTMVSDMQGRLQAAEDRVKECQDALDQITLQSTVSTNNAEVSTVADELEKSQATTDLANAELAFNMAKENRIAELNEEITEKKNQIADLKLLIDNAQSLSGTSAAAPGATPNPNDAVYQERKKFVEEKLTNLKNRC